MNMSKIVADLSFKQKKELLCGYITTNDPEKYDIKIIVSICENWKMKNIYLNHMISSINQKNNYNIKNIRTLGTLCYSRVCDCDLVDNVFGNRWKTNDFFNGVLTKGMCKNCSYDIYNNFYTKLTQYISEYEEREILSEWYKRSNYSTLNDTDIDLKLADFYANNVHILKSFMRRQLFLIDPETNDTFLHRIVKYNFNKDRIININKIINIISSVIYFTGIKYNLINYQNNKGEIVADMLFNSVKNSSFVISGDDTIGYPIYVFDNLTNINKKEFTKIIYSLLKISRILSSVHFVEIYNVRTKVDLLKNMIKNQGIVEFLINNSRHFHGARILHLKEYKYMKKIYQYKNDFIKD